MAGKQTKRSVAYHEAGHALIAWWLGIPIVSVSVGLTVGLVWNNARSKQVVEPSRGRIRFRASMKIKPTLPVPKRHRLDAQICMFVLAGLAAENIHSGEWIEHGPEYAEAMEIARQLYKTERGALNFVNSKVFPLTCGILQEHWPAVIRIADRLMVEAIITADEVRALIEGTTGGDVAPLAAAGA
jgi:hypothetical protein